MNRTAVAVIGDDAIAYTVREGEPVLLFHGAGLADFMAPLADALDGFMVTNYHRVGYGYSSRPTSMITVGRSADHAAGLLDHLNIDSAHLVGHSFGGLVATELALSRPDRTRSLALMEPLHLQVPAAADLAQRIVAPAMDAYQQGQPSRAVDVFMAGVCGMHWRPIAARMLGGESLATARVDAPTLFEGEMPAGLAWQWDDILHLPGPLLLMLGERSHTVSQVYPQGYQDLIRRFPHAEHHIVPGATHLLQLENPDDVATRLTTFFQSTNPPKGT